MTVSETFQRFNTIQNTKSIQVIVKRYAARLQLLSTGLSQHQFLSEVNNIMATFIDFDVPLEEQDPVEVCSSTLR